MAKYKVRLSHDPGSLTPFLSTKIGVYRLEASDEYEACLKALKRFIEEHKPKMTTVKFVDWEKLCERCGGDLYECECDD